MSEASLKHLGWHQMNYIQLTNDTVKDFVIVTAASSDHFSESLDLIGSIHHYYPQHKLIYFDLGLSDSQIKQVIIRFELHTTQDRCCASMHKYLSSISLRAYGMKKAKNSYYSVSVEVFLQCNLQTISI